MAKNLFFEGDAYAPVAPPGSATVFWGCLHAPAHMYKYMTLVDTFDTK